MKNEICEQQGSDAVSYTHLDVYKRQDISCSDSITSFTAYAANVRGIGSIAFLCRRELQKYFTTVIFL